MASAKPVPRKPRRPPADQDKKEDGKKQEEKKQEEKKDEKP